MQEHESIDPTELRESAFLLKHLWYTMIVRYKWFELVPSIAMNSCLNMKNYPLMNKCFNPWTDVRTVNLF